MPGIEPVSARCKAQTLPLCYAVQSANATSVLCRATISVKKGMPGINPWQLVQSANGTSVLCRPPFCIETSETKLAISMNYRILIIKLKDLHCCFSRIPCTYDCICQMVLLGLFDSIFPTTLCRHARIWTHVSGSALDWDLWRPICWLSNSATVPSLLF